MLIKKSTMKKGIWILIAFISTTTFAQKAEEAVGETVQKGARAIADTEIVQNAITKYNQLTPEQKAIVDGVLGTTEGLTTMFGARPVTEAIGTGVKLSNTALRSGLDAIRGATNELSGVVGSGTTGIKNAVTAGFKPEEIMQRVARVSKGKQANFEQMAGESVGQYLVNRNVFGTPDEIVDQLNIVTGKQIGRAHV